MIITNNHNLPKAIYSAVMGFQKNYQSGKTGKEKFTVTELLKPPYLRRLSKDHDDEIEDDVMDRVWTMTGQAIHKVMESQEVENSLTEERLKIDVDGVEVSGQVDHYTVDDEGNYILDDYKFTSVWKVIFGDYEEWTKQLNSYALMYRKLGFQVDKIRVVLILKDWKKSESLYKADYPKFPIVVIELPLWNDEKTLEFLKERVQLHLEAESLPVEEIPVCTPDERWEKPTTYAIMKTGRKTAVRVFDDKSEAEYFMKDLPADHSIEIRQGKASRCEDYCPVKQWCKLYR